MSGPYLREASLVYKDEYEPAVMRFVRTLDTRKITISRFRASNNSHQRMIILAPQIPMQQGLLPITVTREPRGKQFIYDFGYLGSLQTNV